MNPPPKPVSPLAAGVTLTPDAVAKAQAEFAAVAKAITRNPSEPQVIGFGQCQRCRVEGKILATGTGLNRKLSYEGCKCPKVKSR